MNLGVYCCTQPWPIRSRQRWSCSRFHLHLHISSGPHQGVLLGSIRAENSAHKDPREGAIYVTESLGCKRQVLLQVYNSQLELDGKCSGVSLALKLEHLQRKQRWTTAVSICTWGSRIHQLTTWLSSIRYGYQKFTTLRRCFRTIRTKNAYMHWHHLLRYVSSSHLSGRKLHTILEIAIELQQELPSMRLRPCCNEQLLCGTYPPWIPLPFYGLRNDSEAPVLFIKGPLLIMFVSEATSPIVNLKF